MWSLFGVGNEVILYLTFLIFEFDEILVLGRIFERSAIRVSLCELIW